MEVLHPLIEPKEIEVESRKGAKKVIISIIPATYSREIAMQYPLSALPKVGDYPTNAEMMFKMMSYVAIPQGNAAPLRLSTRELIDNHLDFKSLAKVEVAMASYNWDFFFIEDLSNLKERISQTLTSWFTQIMTDSFQLSSQGTKPPSTN